MTGRCEDCNNTLCICTTRERDELPIDNFDPDDLRWCQNKLETITDDFNFECDLRKSMQTKLTAAIAERDAAIAALRLAPDCLDDCAWNEAPHTQRCSEYRKLRAEVFGE